MREGFTWGGVTISTSPAVNRSSARRSKPADALRRLDLDQRGGAGCVLSCAV